MGLDIDRFGHCVRCHKNMLVEAVVGQKVVERFTPEYDEEEYLLNDGSKMRVAVCKTCKAQLKHSNNEFNEIMDCVINGWKEEVVGIKTWDEKKKKDYMDVYSKKKIVVKSDGMPEDILAKHLKEYNKKR